MTHSRSRRTSALGAALLAAGALAVVPASAASAHDQLIAASPAAGSTVVSASAVRLGFDAAVLELGGGRNAIVVEDAAGRHFETACVRVDDTTMTVPVALGAAGTYRVTWRAVSSDGHGVGDTYDFTYRPPAGATVAAGRATSPCAAAADLAARSTAAPSAGGAILAGAIGGGVLLAAVAAVLVVVLRTRRAPAER